MTKQASARAKSKRVRVKENFQFRPGTYRLWLEDFTNIKGFESPQDALKDIIRERMLRDEAQTKI
jgi:hypothetical protein